MERALQDGLILAHSQIEESGKAKGIQQSKARAAWLLWSHWCHGQQRYWETEGPVNGL